VLERYFNAKKGEFSSEEYAQQFADNAVRIKEIIMRYGVEDGSDYSRTMVDNNMDKQVKELAAEVEGCCWDGIETNVVTQCSLSVVMEGIYSGKVLGVDGGVVSQKINREGDVVHHAAAQLSKPVAEGDVIDIEYRNGMGEVSSKGKTAEVGR
jgi:hypothetical protein